MRNATELEYIKLVSEIKIGKHLPDAIYVHESAMVALPRELIQIINSGLDVFNIKKAKWNILKLFRKTFKVSLLNYPRFFSAPYPSLDTSIVMNFLSDTHSIRSYKKSVNPPILHRKETFLLPSHPQVPYFEVITQEGIEAGLYENSKIIGFKKTWNELINQHGYELKDGHLVLQRKL